MAPEEEQEDREENTQGSLEEGSVAPSQGAGLPPSPAPHSQHPAGTQQGEEEDEMAKHLPSVWHRPFLAESGLSRLMNEVFGDFSDVGFDISPSVGKTDVYEKDGNVIYEIELPGIKKDEVEIKIDQGRLTISGETKRSEEVKQEDYFRIGRRYGRFHRSLPLPADIKDETEISVSLKHGILMVSVPLSKSIKEKAKPIEVKVE